jgi:hypothetical protein
MLGQNEIHTFDAAPVCRKKCCVGQSRLDESELVAIPRNERSIEGDANRSKRDRVRGRGETGDWRFTGHV